MKIAIVGVSGVGKTTLMNNLEKRIGNVKVVPEATKGDICKFSNLPLIDHAQATKFQLAKYDIGRVEYQLKLESEARYEGNNKYIIFDKAIPMALMYALTLSSRLIPDSTVNEFVHEVKLHVKRCYDLLVYIPHNPKFKAVGLNRNFINQYLLQVQDSALDKVISWLDCPILIVSQTNFDVRELEVTNYLGVTV